MNLFEFLDEYFDPIEIKDLMDYLGIPPSRSKENNIGIILENFRFNVKKFYKWCTMDEDLKVIAKDLHIPITKKRKAELWNDIMREVQLDDKKYGDCILSIKDKKDEKLSIGMPTKTVFTRIKNDIQESFKYKKNLFIISLSLVLIIISILSAILITMISFISPELDSFIQTLTMLDVLFGIASGVILIISGSIYIWGCLTNKKKVLK